MPPITIYHNARCGKSRGALEILQAQNMPHQVRLYLTDPLTKKELKTLLKKLNMQPSELVRKNESIYKELFSQREYSEKEWLDILVKNPVLIERPIVEFEGTAIIARPPECLFEIIPNS